MGNGEGSRTGKTGVNTGHEFGEKAAEIMSAKGKEPAAAAAAEGKQPGVIILSATYVVAIDIGDGPDKRQHIVQLVNGKKRPDALKDDAVSLNFFTEPPAKLPDKNQMQETIERLSTHLEGVKRQLEDAAAGMPKKKSRN